MFITETEVVTDEEGPHRRQGTTGAGKARLPADFVYDNGQIMLELLFRRAEEEERRGFVEGMRRIGGKGLNAEGA